MGLLLLATSSGQRAGGTGLERTRTTGPVGAERLTGMEFGRCCADYGPGLHHISAATAARARRKADTFALMRWWVELSVIAHLVGWRTPTAIVDIHQDYDSTVAKAAIAYATDEAVASRSSLICDRMNPADFAAHMATSLIGMLEGEAGCRYVEHPWLAAPYQWELVYDELLDHRKGDGDVPCGKPHPKTVGWTVRYDVDIPGRTCVEQTQAVKEWRERLQPRVREDFGFGTDRLSTLERVTGLTRLDPDWPDRAGIYLEAFGARWADRLLITGLRAGA